MKRLIALVAAVVIASQMVVTATASGKSRYDLVMRSPAGREKLAAIARMEESGRIDPTVLTSFISDSEPLVRARCAEALGRIADPAGVPYLAKLTEDPSLQVVESAVYSLGLVGGATVLEPLKRCLTATSPAIRERAIEALGKSGTKEAGRLIAPHLRDFSSALRARAALALAFSGDSASASQCELALSDTDPHVVACAMYAMGRLGYKEGAERIAELLGLGSAEARFRGVEALGRLKADRAVPMVANLTHDTDRWVAIKAAEAIGRIGNPRGADDLAALCASKDDYLKTAALQGLAVIGGKKQLGSILPLLDDASPMVRRAALGACATAGKDDALPYVRAALERGTPPEKMTALELLGTLSAREDLRTLARNTNSARNHLLREGAAAGLGNWARPEELTKPCDFQDSLGRKLTPIEVLIEAADGDDWVVASIAVESLGKVGPVEIIPDLEHVFDAHNGRLDGDRRLAVVEAIGRRASKLDAGHVEALGLKEFFARASTDPDPRVATASAATAGKLAIAIKAAPSGTWERGNVPWKEAQLPLGERKILIATARGNIEVTLFGDDAPCAVKSILSLAESGFYNGLSFHRVVPGFVIQGGCPRGDGWGDGGWLLRNEINMYGYERAIVGMADSGKDTGGSQFFITHTAQPHLNGRYTIVGKVTGGMHVVDSIEEGDTFTVKVVE